MDEEKFIKFLVQAKTKGYASGITYVPGTIQGTKEFSFTDGKLKYTDVYSGSAFFIGQEMVYENDTPMWGMVYSGGLLDDNYEAKEIYEFLRNALKKMPEDFPLRGKESFSNGEFIYNNSTEGDMWHFIGYEAIEHKENIVYELHYSGGYIE
jgi:hypothetical protein